MDSNGNSNGNGNNKKNKQRNKDKDKDKDKEKKNKNKEGKAITEYFAIAVDLSLCPAGAVEVMKTTMGAKLVNVKQVCYF